MEEMLDILGHCMSWAIIGRRCVKVTPVSKLPHFTLLFCPSHFHKELEEQKVQATMSITQLNTVIRKRCSVFVKRVFSQLVKMTLLFSTRSPGMWDQHPRDGRFFLLQSIASV